MKFSSADKAKLLCVARAQGGETLELVQTVPLVSDIIIVSCVGLTWMHFKGSVGKMASMQLQVLPIAYCNRLPDLAYYPVSLALALPSYTSYILYYPVSAIY